MVTSLHHARPVSLCRAQIEADDLENDSDDDDDAEVGREPAAVVHTAGWRRVTQLLQCSTQERRPLLCCPPVRRLRVAARPTLSTCS